MSIFKSWLIANLEVVLIIMSVLFLGFVALFYYGQYNSTSDDSYLGALLITAGFSIFICGINVSFIKHPGFLLGLLLVSLLTVFYIWEAEHDSKTTEITVQEGIRIQDYQIEVPQERKLETDGSKVEEPQYEEPSVEESRLEEIPMEEHPMEESPEEESPVEEAQIEESPAEESPAEEPQVEEPSVEESQVEVPSVEESQVDESQIQEMDSDEETDLEYPHFERLRLSWFIVAAIIAFLFGLYCSIYANRYFDDVVSRRFLYRNSDVSVFEVQWKYTFNRFFAGFITVFAFALEILCFIVLKP